VTISIEGPGRAEVNHNFERGRMRVSYRVQEAGYYSLSVRYSGQHVTGSPFKVKVLIGIQLPAGTSFHQKTTICRAGTGSPHSQYYLYTFSNL